MSPNPRPQRIQLRRTKGWRKPEGAVVVARPSKWGNPWRVVKGTAGPNWPWTIDGPDCRPGGLWFSTHEKAAAYAVRRYRERSPLNVADLAGRDLACWCPLDQPCHADVLLELANPAAGPVRPSQEAT